MKTIAFRSNSFPEPSLGKKAIGKKIVVPDQSMSLAEILARFSRNEKVPVGHDVQYDESDVDIAKLGRMDLVDREEYVKKLKSTQEEYEKQEKRKQERVRKEAQAKVEEEIRASERAKLDAGKRQDEPGK